MNAIDFLIKEHDKVRALLADISDSSHRFETKKKLFDKLSEDLICHEKMEETVWYPELKTNKKLIDEIKHLVKEEKDAEKVIKEIKSLSDETKWEEMFKAFKKDVEHHASEEEKELFPLVKKHFTDTELENIGKNMFIFEQEY